MAARPSQPWVSRYDRLRVERLTPTTVGTAHGRRGGETAKPLEAFQPNRAIHQLCHMIRGACERAYLDLNRNVLLRRRLEDRFQDVDGFVPAELPQEGRRNP